jgi:hypothetical protein
MDINKLYEQAKSEEYISFFELEKNSFEILLSGLIVKVFKSKSGEAQSQLKMLERMQRYLSRQSYKNVIFRLQAKMLVENERQINILELENRELLEENLNLKKNI